MTDKPSTTVKYLCEFYGISQTELSRKFDIPLRTVQDWYAERRTPPAYVVNMLMELLLRAHCERERERSGVYLIYTDSMDDASTIVGYCLSEAEANQYCEDHQSEYYNELTWQLLERL